MFLGRVVRLDTSFTQTCSTILHPPHRCTLLWATAQTRLPLQHPPPLSCLPCVSDFWRRVLRSDVLFMCTHSRVPIGHYFRESCTRPSCYRLFDPLIRSPAAFSTLSYSPVDCLDWDGGMGDAFRDVGSDEAWDRLLDLPGKNDEVSEPDASSSSSSPSSSSSSSSTISVISESWMKLTISE